MQYANSLIGRQLKTVAQTSVFHVYDLVGDTQFALWKAMGELAPLLWFPEIRNMDTYLVCFVHQLYKTMTLTVLFGQRDIEVAVGNVLDLFVIMDPKRIMDKVKLHLLAHIREDVLRFGPLVGVATEIFECFNAVFRTCSILSNHLAPSRDIAHQLADQEGMKHRLTGGYWASADDDLPWEHSGTGVCDFLHRKPILQSLYGWTDPTPPVPGQFKYRFELSYCGTGSQTNAGA